MSLLFYKLDRIKILPVLPRMHFLDAGACEGCPTPGFFRHIIHVFASLEGLAKCLPDWGCSPGALDICEHPLVSSSPLGTKISKEAELKEARMGSKNSTAGLWVQ